MVVIVHYIPFTPVSKISFYKYEFILSLYSVHFFSALHFFLSSFDCIWSFKFPCEFYNQIQISIGSVLGLNCIQVMHLGKINIITIIHLPTYKKGISFIHLFFNNFTMPVIIYTYFSHFSHFIQSLHI